MILETEYSEKFTRLPQSLQPREKFTLCRYKKKSPNGDFC